MLYECIEFGYLPKQINIATNSFKIVPKYNLQDLLINGDYSNAIVNDGWIFLSQDRTTHGHRLFELPFTHDFHFDKKVIDRDTVDFLVWCLGFLYGMRLVTANPGFVDATPISPGKFVDFVSLKESQLTDILLMLHQIFSKEKDQRNLLMSAMNTFFWSQSPLNFEFESFQFIYMAIDAIFRLVENQSIQTTKKRILHKERLEFLCDEFNIKITPSFIQSVVDIRNDLIHEAMVAGKPMGYSIFPQKHGNIHLKLQKLVCRLIMCSMGLKLLPEHIGYLDGINERGIYKIEFLA